MKLGRTVQSFAAEVIRQSQAKSDLLAPVSMLDLAVESTPASTHPGASADLDSIIAATSTRHFDTPDVRVGTLKLVVPGYGSFPMNDLVHSQLAEYVGIHKTYYDRMKSEAPDLLRTNVLHWLRQKGDTRMVRILDGNARAFLSDKYRPLDHIDLLRAVLPPLQQAGAQIVSSECTPNRLYIKALVKSIRFEPRVGDIVEAGVMIQNSEVGLGSLAVFPYLNRLVCSNGMVCNEFGTRKAHIGRRNGGDTDTPTAWLKDETRKVLDAGFFMQIADTVSACFDEAKFAVIAGKVTKSTQREFDGAEPKNVISVVQDRYQFTSPEADAMLKHLCESGDYTQYGLANSINRMAADVESYDRSTDHERLAYAVTELGDSDWMRVVKDARESAKRAVN